LSAEDIEWIIPGEDWPLAGTHRGHAGLADLLQKANETVETSYPEPPEFVAQGDRVLVVGFATGKIKATNKAFEDHWVFAITVRNGKADEHPGVYRHASTGAGLRDGREPQATVTKQLSPIRFLPWSLSSEYVRTSMRYQHPGLESIREAIDQRNLRHNPRHSELRVQ
jgi:hypothetical protein